MSRVYDSWEKLVGAVLDREELRRLALCDSFTTSNYSDHSSRFSFDSSAASSGRNNFSYPIARPIELKEIRKATENFRPAMFIGQGVMCQAFRAWIDEHALVASKPGSGMAVTVKKWCNYLERHQDWLKKIDYLVQLRHPKLVNLVGYCTEEDNMMLVYEFMPNGSLSDHLFTTQNQSLPWTRRIRVALDVARGLCYLHDRDRPIIHRDFKLDNIFLDWELNAKLSNYSYGTDDPTGEKACVGTHQVFVAHGYTAPEYTLKGHLTTKSNVYTFGVVLLELLSGTLASNLNLGKSYFGTKSRLLQIIDVRLGGQYSHDAAYEVVKLALKCLNQDPKARPRMADVVVALQQLQGHEPVQ
ncbi:probable serine/threonine-protein kinase PBL3 [Salvia miltiorrhiza]|uniref:probable serine/threonine-protein kinase PBL3 n=1 Tax=Salvia miltiorrhiza TaxID=226208 RepID=UPI0025ACE787|nr:probable serine/threonine-protein kinase PBL3 [Salvia miltiorrhiza]